MTVDETMTVGDLINHLCPYDPDLPLTVVIDRQGQHDRSRGEIYEVRVADVLRNFRCYSTLDEEERHGKLTGVSLLVFVP